MKDVLIGLKPTHPAAAERAAERYADTVAERASAFRGENCKPSNWMRICEQTIRSQRSAAEVFCLATELNLYWL